MDNSLNTIRCTKLNLYLLSGIAYTVQYRPISIKITSSIRIFKKAQGT